MAYKMILCPANEEPPEIKIEPTTRSTLNHRPVEGPG
jgi:hypothetical protein